MKKNKIKTKNHLLKSNQANKASEANQVNLGFTLIEILISLSILFIILGGITLFSVRTLQSYTRSRAMQNAVENSRFAIESLSKKIRTSHGLGLNSSSVFFIDNVDNTPYCYNFDGSKLRLKKGTAGSSEARCSDISDSSYDDLVGGNNTNITVTGNFSGQNTTATERGFVIILITITYAPSGSDTPAEQDEVKIRSTVSLRDYDVNN